MKIKKLLFLSLFLIIGLLLFIPNSVNAETRSATIETTNGNEVKLSYELENDEIINLKCVNTDTEKTTITGRVEIPATIDGYKVRTLGYAAFMRMTELKSVYIPDGVTSIGTYAFAYCANLENVELPNGLSVLPANIFEGCTSLTTLEIPDSVTEMQQAVFHTCESLTSVSIPDSVRKIWRAAFYGCTNLETVLIAPTTNDIDETAFNNCPKLTIKCSKDSKAYAVASSKGIPYDIVFHNVEYSINNLSCEDSIYVKKGENYASVLLPSAGYKNPKNISIKINGRDLSSSEFEYNCETGELKLSAEVIDGDIKIIAEGEKMHKAVFDANNGIFNDGNNTLTFDDAEEILNKEIETPKRNGYKFLGYFTEKDGGLSYNDIMNSEAGIQSDITFYARWEKVYTYTFITGDNQKFTINKIDEYSFKVDGDYKLFSKIIIDKLNLEKDIDYKVEKGSTIITFTETGLAKLNTLEIGTYDVVVKYSNDENAVGKLIIEADKTINDNTENTPSEDNKDDIEKEDITTNNKDNTENEDTTKPTGNNPQTSDNIVIFIIILGVATMGIIITSKIRKSIKE